MSCRLAWLRRGVLGKELPSGDSRRSILGQDRRVLDILHISKELGDQYLESGCIQDNGTVEGSRRIRSVRTPGVDPSHSGSHDSIMSCIVASGRMSSKKVISRLVNRSMTATPRSVSIECYGRREHLPRYRVGRFAADRACCGKDVLGGNLFVHRSRLARIDDQEDLIVPRTHRWTCRGTASSPPSGQLHRRGRAR